MSGSAEAYGLWRQSLSQSRYSWRSGYTAPISKWTSFGSKLGFVGTGLGLATITNDAIDVSKNKMGWGRFSYHLAGLGTSLGFGYMGGGPAGAAVGVGFGAGEIIYDEVIYPKVGVPFNQSFEGFMKSYFNIPGWNYFVNEISI